MRTGLRLGARGISRATFLHRRREELTDVTHRGLVGAAARGLRLCPGTRLDSVFTLVERTRKSAFLSDAQYFQRKGTATLELYWRPPWIACPESRAVRRRGIAPSAD